MFNYRLISISIFICLISFSSVLIADDIDNKKDVLTAFDWLQKDKELQDWCNQKPIEINPLIFTETLKKARKIRSDYCNLEFSNPDEIETRIINLIGDLDILFPKSFFYLPMHSAEMSRANITGELAQFKVIEGPPLAVSLDHPSLYRIEDNENSKLLTECNESAKAKSPGASCESALKEFKVIYNFAQATYAQPLAYELSKRLGSLETKWNKFFKKSKSQTLLELFINGTLFHKEYKEHKFAEPPEWQLVVMHPNVVIENVSGAIDGDELKESIMVEAIGADWWKQKKWYIPSGGSIVANYSDRAGVNDWGYGISLNFKSRFTIGASNHGGDIGFFMTVDLLKLIQDKASTLKNYRETADF